MGDVEFPDDMSNDQIATAIKAQLPQPTSKASDPSLYDPADARKNAAMDYGKQAARALGLTGRSLINVAATPPLLAADAGVAARNLVTGSNYDNATAMWNQGLDAYGVPKPANTWEKGVDVVGQALIGGKLPGPTISNPAPASFNPQAMRDLAFQKAQEAGYVVPPATTNPTVTNRFLESWGGKVATAQDASARNQPVTDALVKGDLGIPASQDVGEGAMATIRQEASNTGYKPLGNVGTIRLDTTYGKTLEGIAAPYVKAEGAFPGLNKNDISATVESLKQKSVDTSTAMDSISILREKADTAFRQGDSGAGRAYKSMAKALEDAIERSLERRGPEAQTLLSEFRDARKLIAKTYSAEKALNPELGSFDARKLAQQLNAGKPLSGGMKKAAQASQAFKEATKLMTDSGSVRNTDVILGGGAAALSGNPLPLLYPFSRMAARDFMLSPTGQGLLASPAKSYGAPQTAMGLLYGSNSLRQ